MAGWVWATLSATLALVAAAALIGAFTWWRERRESAALYRELKDTLIGRAFDAIMRVDDDPERKP